MTLTLCKEGKHFIGCVEEPIPYIFPKCRKGYYLSFPMAFREALVLYKVFGRDYISKVFYDRFLGHYVSEEPERWELKEAQQRIEEAMSKSVDFLPRLSESEMFRSGLERILAKVYRLTSTPVGAKNPSLFFPDSVVIPLNPPEVSEYKLSLMLNGMVSLEPYRLGENIAYVPTEAFFGTYNNLLARQAIAVQTVGMKIPEARDYVLKHVMPYVLLLLGLHVSRLIVRGKK